MKSLIFLSIFHFALLAQSTGKPTTKSLYYSKHTFENPVDEDGDSVSFTYIKKIEKTNGVYLAGGLRNGQIRVVDVGTNQVKFTLNATDDMTQLNPVTALDSYENGLLASMSYDNKIHVFETDSGSLKFKLDTNIGAYIGFVWNSMTSLENGYI
jgi:WD40 repeat protein